MCVMDPSGSLFFGWGGRGPLEPPKGEMMLSGSSYLSFLEVFVYVLEKLSVMLFFACLCIEGEESLSFLAERILSISDDYPPVMSTTRSDLNITELFKVLNFEGVVERAPAPLEAGISKVVHAKHQKKTADCLVSNRGTRRRQTFYMPVSISFISLFIALINFSRTKISPVRT